MNRPRRPVELPTRHTARRCRTPLPAQVDVAVVGAGLGGLMAGAVLARVGLSVVLLDGHYVAGGCATMFSRVHEGRRWCFDVGLHYVGEAGPGQRIPRLLDAVGASVEFLPLDPDGFDRLHLPGLTLAIPWSIEAWRDRLVATFPRERAGIDRYVRALEEVERISRAARDADGRLTPGFLWRLLTRGRTVLRYRDATIAEVLDDCTREPLLRAALLGQHGDHGVAPSRASAVAHLALSAHYFRGAWYPRGGGQQVADALADVVELAGGSICLRRAVRAIRLRDGRACGVETADGDVVEARVVLSNADLPRTLRELLPADALPPAWRARAARFVMAGAIHLLCLGVRRDLHAAGLRPGNDWISDEVDPEAIYDALAAGDLRPRAVCMTSGTVKDPDTPGHAPPGHHTLELMALVPGRPEAWGVDPAAVPKRRYKDDATYVARKAAVDEALLCLAERVLPGLSGDVVYAESATPVTHTRFTGATDGTPYGLAVTPDQFGAGRPDVHGPVPDLYLCGASTRSAHGVIGALHSGWRAARVILRRFGLPAPRLP